MNNIFFILALGMLLAVLLSWGFRHLPRERWQMLAVIPYRKCSEKENRWLGTNLTYYGFFIATSQLCAMALLISLLGAINILPAAIAPPLLTVLFFAIPAARLLAILVEKKRHTFTVGGASFVGIILAPWALLFWAHLLDDDNHRLPIIPVLAAMSIGYTLGEGLGRLGCISFGCCYGKPVKDCSQFSRKVLRRIAVIFSGETKKASYESRLAGEPLVPIQAITCVMYTSGALAGSLLFLQGSFTLALILTITVTQLWRIVSELWRADFRGSGRISAYQLMGLISVFYILALCLFLPPPASETTDIVAGLKTLWDPAVILGLQAMWLLYFIHFGRSTITAAEISFQLRRDRI